MSREVCEAAKGRSPESRVSLFRIVLLCVKGLWDASDLNVVAKLGRCMHAAGLRRHRGSEHPGAGR